jgi:SAM-dependent methyltransferase
MLNAMTLQLQPYPSEVEQWWLNQACGSLPGVSREDCLTKFVPVVDRLSGLFTTERSVAFGGYGQDRDLLLAYGLFFFPQTFTRVQFPLVESLRRSGWQPGEGPLRVLDLGTGSGAALIGAVEVLQAAGQREIEACGIDRSEKALAFARGLTAEQTQRWPGVKWTFSNGDLAAPSSWPAGRWDLVVSSFALNEAFHGRPLAAVETWTQEALSRLAPGGLLLLIEPALKETSERLEGLRDRFAEQGNVRIVGPCLHSFACPLLAGGEYWCHEVRDWEPPESVQFLNRRLFRGIQQVKFSFIALGSGALMTETTAALEVFRLISPVVEKKGRLVATGCAADGQRYTYEWQTRALTRNEIKALTQHPRGLVLQADKVVRKGDVLRIQGETTIHS